MSSLAGLPPLPKSLSGLLNLPGADSTTNTRECSPAHTSHSSPYRPQPAHRSNYLAGSGVEVSGGLYANVAGRRSSDLPSYQQQQQQPVPALRRISEGSSANSRSPEGGSTAAVKAQVLRKFSSLDSQLAFLRKEMVSLRQIDMNLLCQLWSLNETMQEFKSSSRHSSLSPHDWLDQEDGEEDSDASEEYYSGGDYATPEDSYSQPVGSVYSSHRQQQGGGGGTTNYSHQGVAGYAHHGGAGAGAGYSHQGGAGGYSHGGTSGAGVGGGYSQASGAGGYSQASGGGGGGGYSQASGVDPLFRNGMASDPRLKQPNMDSHRYRNGLN